MGSTFGAIVSWSDTQIVATVASNATSGTVQVRQYGDERARGCELLPSRYDLVAAALGGHGELVERADDLDGAIARAVASGLPACVNVMIEGVAAPTFQVAAATH